MSAPEIKVLPDLKALTLEAASRIINAARGAIEGRGKFSIALSGGSTPRPVYELLAAEPYRSQLEWAKVEIYFGDEQCVPPDSDESNFRMARGAMLEKLPIPAGNVHRIRGELDPNEAAIEYGQLLKQKFGDGGLDLILLGMGLDGHIASLFPGTTALHETRHRCTANYVPKFDGWRVTMTAPFINRAASVIFLVSGADKAARVSEVLQGPRHPNRLPSQLIAPAHGRLTWLLDSRAAADGVSSLSREKPPGTG